MAVDINFSLMEWQKKVQKISCIKYFDSNVSIEKKKIYIYIHLLHGWILSFGIILWQTPNFPME